MCLVGNNNDSGGATRAAGAASGLEQCVAHAASRQQSNGNRWQHAQRDAARHQSANEGKARVEKNKLIAIDKFCLQGLEENSV